MPEEHAASLEVLEAVIGTPFRDRRLLRSALTHRSYLNEVESRDADDNERLEFLGDAVVDFVAGEHAYRSLPEAREGDLTAVRAAMVCETALARFAADIALGAHLRLGRGEEATGGRSRPTTLSNAFEALVGAIYLDQGLAAAEAFVLRFLRPALHETVARHELKDAKSRLQELAQGAWQLTPQYRTEAEAGPDHAKRFVVSVSIGDACWGTGEGRSKAEAARAAAGMAIERIAGQHPELGGA